MIIIENIRQENLNQALKKLKKKWEDSGTLLEWRDRKYFEKPSSKKRKQKEQAVRKQLKRAKVNLEFKNTKNIPKKYIGI